MTTEEKAKAYDEAIERAKKLHKDAITLQLEQDIKDYEYIFPELAESEDERIRKEILNVFKQLGKDTTLCGRNYDYAKWIAWLEKQKEFVSADFDDVWETADCDELTAPLDKYSKDAIKKMCHAWYDKGIELERRNWLEKQGEQKPIIKMKSPEESLGISSKEYNEIVNDCLYGKSSPTDIVEPKFKEGEDERIRKHLINCVTRTIPEADAFKEISKEQILAWLEKQGTSYTKRDVDNAFVEGMALAKDELEKQGRIDNCPLEGSTNTVMTDSKKNQVEPNPYSGTSFEYNGHIWGMCARDGGAEVSMDGNLKAFISSDASFIYPDIPQPNLAPKSALEEFKEEKVDNANKVEQNLANSAKTCKKSQRMVSAEAKEALYDKPAWSEEDEEMLDGIILRCEKYGHQEQINWLKSIKQRIKGE